MSSATVSLALALLAAGFSPEASAYPGAKAEDLQATVEIQSICHGEDVKSHQTYLLGYTTPTAIIENGHCPAKYSVLIRSYPVQRASTPAAEATGNTVFHWIPNRNTFAGGKDYSLEHRIEFFEEGQSRITEDISEARMSELRAKLVTASPQNAVLVTFDYSKRSMTNIERTSTKSEESIKIVALCESAGKTYGYSFPNVPKHAPFCPDNYQFKLYGYSEAATIGWFNRVEELQGPMLDKYRIQISSQFGLPLFESEISGGKFVKIRRDLLTVSQEHPVTVIVDQGLKAVISVTPSISPYAL
jgi:hypothetical protein